MNEKLTESNENSKEIKEKNRIKKRKIAKIILPIVVIMITAGSAVGVSFAIKGFNKDKQEKTGNSTTSATYSKVTKINKIYK